MARQPSQESIWFGQPTLEFLQEFIQRTAVTALDIKVTEVGPDFLAASMPVSWKSVQPARILHGGVSCVLAETLGSIASYLCINPEKETAVGQTLSASHLRPVPEGEEVTGVAKVLHKGRKSHIWIIQIFNGEKKLVCDSKLTTAILATPSPKVPTL